MELRVRIVPTQRASGLHLSRGLHRGGTLWCGGLMWGPATFVFGLISLVQAQADSRGQLTVCIVEAYNLENLDADEPFGGSASDPCAACCATLAPRS